MTCVATDGKIMAADGLVVADRSLILDRAFPKMTLLTDGRVFGGAGDIPSIVQAAKWLNAGADPEVRPLLEKDSFEGLIIDGSDRVIWFDHDCVLVPYAAPFAIGVGMQIAVALMRDGTSPLQAVEAAARNHATVGGQITELAPRKDRY